MKKALILLLILLLLSAAGLAGLMMFTDLSLPSFMDPVASLLRRDAGSGESSAVIYRVIADTAEFDADLIQAEACSFPQDSPPNIDSVLSLFSSPSKDESLLCALPQNVTVNGWTQENRVITLSLSADFLNADPMSQTVAAFCAALTLCELDGVESVTITSGGETLFSGLVPEDALLSVTDTDPYVRQLRLYFTDSEERYLASEYHTLTLGEDTSPERYVVEELLRGPNSGELKSPIPTGTELLSCATVDSVCVVNLSEEFVTNRPQTALGERLAVYAIVNSLTALSGVDSVNLLVNGQPIGTYVYRSLAEPVGWYGEAIGPASASSSEFDTDLYLVTPDLSAITPLPFRVDQSNYASRAEAALSALMTAAEPGYPALFSGSGSVTGITTRGYLCTVDLSESFFASLPPEARNAAVQSIAATLCGLEEISSVYFTIGGNAAIFEGIDWSGPWSIFDEIEVQ